MIDLFLWNKNDQEMRPRILDVSKNPRTSRDIYNMHSALRRVHRVQVLDLQRVFAELQKIKKRLACFKLRRRARRSWKRRSRSR